MPAEKLVSCSYTGRKGERLEEKLMNRGLSNTLSVLVVAQEGLDKKCCGRTEGYHGGKRWEGCPLLDPKSGGFLLQLQCQKTPLPSTAHRKADLAWAPVPTQALLDGDTNTEGTVSDTVLM